MPGLTRLGQFARARFDSFGSRCLSRPKAKGPRRGGPFTTYLDVVAEHQETPVAPPLTTYGRRLPPRLTRLGQLLAVVRRQVEDGRTAELGGTRSAGLTHADVRRRLIPAPGTWGRELAATSLEEANQSQPLEVWRGRGRKVAEHYKGGRSAPPIPPYDRRIRNGLTRSGQLTRRSGKRTM
jgi:hypothetical protein